MTEYWLLPLEHAEGPVWRVEGERNCYWFSFMSRILGLRRIEAAEHVDCRILDFSAGQEAEGQFLGERKGLGLSFFEDSDGVVCRVSPDADFLWMPAPGFLWRSWFMCGWYPRLRSGAAQIFHGGCVLREGKALLFTGRSGMGKSTLARRIQGTVGADDLCVLLRCGGSAVTVIPGPTWSLYYRPFRELTACALHSSAALCGVILLGRAAHDRWETLNRQDRLMGITRGLTDGNSMVVMGIGLPECPARDLNLRSFDFAFALAGNYPFALFSAGLNDPPVNLFSEFELQKTKE